MLFLYVFSFFSIFLLVCLAFFSFSWLSPIPYFPSNKRDLPLILKAINLSSHQCIVDLGAGDGAIIFEAAGVAREKKLTTEFIAVEVNPILLLILFFRRLFHAHRNRIHIVRADMFSLSHEKMLRDCGIKNIAITYYLYISPWMINKVVMNIVRTYTRPFNLTSYLYPLPEAVKRSLRPDRIRSLRGVHTVYGYYALCSK